MKYYYAVVYCNTPTTAKFLYDEYNGFEFENSNILLNMSFIPDEIKFTQELKDSADEVPDNYEFNFDQQKKLNRALGHSKVKLTWDQTDAKREAKLQNGFKIQFKDSDDEAQYYKDIL